MLWWQNAWKCVRHILDKCPVDQWNVSKYEAHCNIKNIKSSCDYHLFLFYSRRTPFTLMVALDSNDEASGELFWDDGESIGKNAMKIID